MSSKTFFLLLTLLASAVFIAPELNFQDVLAQGDHGRDLYAFEAVYQHQLPYKDFWWVYGPLMPYYYGLFYKIFGLHISSILICRALLLLGCAAFFYLSSARLASPLFSCLAALWFIEHRQEFSCTYSHLGGTLSSLVVLFCLLSYIQQGTLRHARIALAVTFLLMLIKVNFGIVSLLILLVGVALTDASKSRALDPKKMKFYLDGILFVPLAAALVYWLLLKDLPSYAIHQCLPYFGDDEPYHTPPCVAIHSYFSGLWFVFKSTGINTLIGVVFNGLGLAGLGVLLTGKLKDAKNWRLYLLLTITCFGLYFHEYLLSNVYYRSFWSYPFFTFFYVVVMALGVRLLHPVLRGLLAVLTAALLVSGISSHIGKIQALKTPDHYLNMPRGGIYVGNEKAWVGTVNQATAYLNQHLEKNELFFAMPYDCLYYYLTGRLSPTRQLIFFDHIHIPQEQEMDVIKDLQSKHVNWVLVSTRMVSLEQGLGIFGRTYCPLLARYLSDNFIQVYNQGGDPQVPPGWADNHGVFILRRK